jgi:hypothetical protein
MLQPIGALALGVALCCPGAGFAQSVARTPEQSPAQLQAQLQAQKELNALTGAPAGTRCFKSIKRAQEFATRYTASGICPQLRPMDPGQFLQALQVQNAVDKDFMVDACQAQFALMLRAGREWVLEDRPGRCAETLRKLGKLKGLNAFRGLIR